MHGSNPTKTTSIENVWNSYEGQEQPIDKRQSDLNPPAHGFNKASRKKDPHTWGGC